MSNNRITQLVCTGVLLLSLCALSPVCFAYTDPPGRIARLDDVGGEVSYAPSGEDEWIDVARNRPLIRGDRLWTAHDSRAEIQVGSAFVRLGSDTSFEFLDLNDQVAQIRLAQGTLNLRIRRMVAGESYEVATPTLAFTIDRVGRYRIDVAPDDDQTTVVVWDGGGVAYGENANFPLRSGEAVRFSSKDLRDYAVYALPQADAFDRYCQNRDEYLDRSASRRYVNDDVAGYADLDDYGSWRPVGQYGNGWFPRDVDAGWAPYREGHWVWQEPWGWTWVDKRSWGFATSHYGRWVHVSDHWGWIPGSRHARAIYAPALVAFIGGHDWGVSLSLGGGDSIGWFPLGPREVYVPSYRASRDYFTQVNVNNTVINATTLTTVYDNYASGNTNVTQVNYSNRAIDSAITAVPSTVFANAQPVHQAALRLDRSAIARGEISRLAPIAPTVRSVTGQAAAARAQPSREALDRGVIARRAPPEAERSFASRAQELQQHPGQTPAPRAGDTGQGRGGRTPQGVRVITEQRRAVNARALGPVRAAGDGRPPAAAPSPPKPLDRSVKPGNESPRRQDEGTPRETRRDLREAQPPAESATQSDKVRQPRDAQNAERQGQADEQRQAPQQRQAESDRRAAKQQNAERQGQADERRQAPQQRQAETDRQAVKQQNAERQGQSGRARQSGVRQPPRIETPPTDGRSKPAEKPSRTRPAKTQEDDKAKNAKDDKNAGDGGE